MPTTKTLTLGGTQLEIVSEKIQSINFQIGVNLMAGDPEEFNLSFRSDKVIEKK